MAVTISERLAEHVVGLRFEDLPDAVTERAKDLLAHHVGLALAGHSEDFGRRAVALAAELSTGAGSSTLVGDRRRVTMLDAIFAFCELVHFKRDDTHLRAKMTIGRVAHGVAWSVGEREHATGKDLITALVVGYDVACRLAEPQPMGGEYHRTPHKSAFAAFAAAAVATRLLGHDRARAAEAIGRAAHLHMGLNVGLEDSFAFSLAARAGTMAALTSGAGRTAVLPSIESPLGFYAALFDGPPAQLDESLALLGREYSILGASTKPYVMSASHIAPLDAAIAAIAGKVLEADEVVSLVATVPFEFRGRFTERESGILRSDPSDEDVRRALQVKLALAVLDGEIVAQPELPSFRRPDVQRLLPKVSLSFEPIAVDAGCVEIRLKDGRVLRGEGLAVPEARGEWSAMPGIEGKDLLPRSKLSKLEYLLAHLEDVRDVGEVLACTVPER